MEFDKSILSKDSPMLIEFLKAISKNPEIVEKADEETPKNAMIPAGPVCCFWGVIFPEFEKVVEYGDWTIMGQYYPVPPLEMAGIHQYSCFLIGCGGKLKWVCPSCEALLKVVEQTVG